MLKKLQKITVTFSTSKKILIKKISNRTSVNQKQVKCNWLLQNCWM